MSEENKAVVRRYFEGDRDGRDNVVVWDEVCERGIVLAAPGWPEVRGLEALKQFTSAMHSGFTDLRLAVDDMVAEGDKVAARWTMRGTHTAPLPLPTGTLPPTGNTITVSGISICRLVNGKIAEERVQGDWLGMMQQLGVIPAPGQPMG